MSSGEGVPFECVEPGARHSTAGSANRWSGRDIGHGGIELWSRTIFVRESIETDGRGDSRGFSHALQSIPHTARTDVHQCNFGGGETVLEGQDQKKGKKIQILLIIP